MLKLIVKIRLFFYRFRRKTGISILLSFCTLISYANQDTVCITGNKKTPYFSVISASEKGYIFANEINTFTVKQQNTPIGSFWEIMITGYGKTTEYGKPQLPVLSKIIEVPDSSIPIIKITSFTVKYYILNNYNCSLIPAQPSLPKNKDSICHWYYDKTAYANNEFIGDSLISYEYQGIMNESALGLLKICPFQYNPITHVLRVFENLTFEISFKNSFRKNILLSPIIDYQLFENKIIRFKAGVENIVENKQPPVYVIVAPAQYREVLQPFIRWKTEKGFKVIAGVTNDAAIGNTTQSIKSWLTNIYNSLGADNPPSAYLLLAGDITQIPAFTSETHVTDLYYAEYTGDFLPEIQYGRFPASTTADLSAMINKTIDYEQVKQPDVSYLNHSILIAGADRLHQLSWSNPQAGYPAAYYLNESAGVKTNLFLQPEPSNGNYRQQIAGQINTGFGYLYYTSHGSEQGWSNPTLSIADTGLFENTGKYGLVVSNSCSSAAYQTNCFGNAWLRLPARGALAYIGASGLTFWDEDYWWSVGNSPIPQEPTPENKGAGVYDRIFKNNYSPALGEILFAGNISVMESNSENKKYYWETYNLLGDPSVNVFFQQPKQLLSNYNKLISKELNIYTVKTNAGARLTLSRDGNLISTLIANSAGEGNFDVNALQSGKYLLVITLAGYKPVIDTLIVVPNLTENPPFSIYPNPFTNQLNIDYQLIKSDNVIINLYNSKGTLCKTVDLGNQPSGIYHTEIQLNNLLSGLYICTIKLDNKHQSIKLICK